MSRDAISGKHAAVLKSGETRLPMLHFTHGVTHRFTCLVKASAETEIVLRFNARFNGKDRPDSYRVRVGTEWTPVELEVTPHEDLTQRYNAAITVAAGANLLIDRVRFRPLPDPSSDSDPLPPNFNNRVLVAQDRSVRVQINRQATIKTIFTNVTPRPSARMQGLRMAQRTP